MAFIESMGQQLATIREFVWPTYQPERYYMRGPGPACQRLKKIAKNTTVLAGAPRAR